MAKLNCVALTVHRFDERVRRSMRAARFFTIVPLAACSAFATPPMPPGGAMPASRLVAPTTTLFVLNAGNGTVTIYKAPFTSSSKPFRTVKVRTPSYSMPDAIAVSGSGTIFVANRFYDDRAHLSVEMYAPPYNQRRLIAKCVRASAVALDDVGNLLVAEQRGIKVYAPPYRSAPVAHFPGSHPQFDGHRHVFVRERTTVEMFETPRYTSAVRSFQSHIGILQTIAVSSRGDLFMADDGYKGPFELYLPPYKGKSEKIQKYAVGGVNEMSALAAGTLFAMIGETGDNAVYEYVPPYQSRRKQIGSRQGDGQVLARDDRLFVSDFLGGVKVYVSPFDGTPALITNGVDNPAAIAVTP